VSEQPDAAILPAIEPDRVLLAATKKARRALNARFERPRPRWWPIEGDDEFGSPDYRAIGIERGAALAAMAWHLHDAGMSVVWWCEKCGDLHALTDAQLPELKFFAITGAEGVSPAHGTPQ
jgi:hypothetical protein